MNRNLRNALLGLGAGAIAAPVAGLGVGPSLMKLQTMLPESKAVKNLLAEMSYIDIRDALLGRPTSGVPEIMNYGVEELKPFKNKHLFGSLKASQLVDKLLGNDPVPASILSGGMMPSTLAESARDRLIKGNLALAGGGATLGGILGALAEPSESEKVSSANFIKQAKKELLSKSIFNTLSKNPTDVALPLALLAGGTGYLLGRDSDS